MGSEPRQTPTDGFEHLLPAERLIAGRRNERPADALRSAASVREAAIDLVREGYLMHYRQSRYYEIDDADFALLAGDRMYAAGLAALSEAGDIEAVSVLARLIAACAEAHAARDEHKADLIWRQSLAMLAPGSNGE